ncbi:MAG TPA: NOP5/NOP56 family protein [Candidatus Nanoarchaeia archaeon]|nr:NOP5/NOP56 family protein [Candidatus Nanoarchaeia archaeon]
MNYAFKNILGTFIIDESFTAISNKDDLKAKEVPPEKISAVLALFKNKLYFKQFYQENLKLTKAAIKNSVQEDQLIMQAISNISELDKINNLLSKRLREWYSLYLPELSELIQDHQTFLKLISQPKSALIKEFNISDSMGADLDKKDIDQISLLAAKLTEIYELKNLQETYLQGIMEKYCPNLLELAGTTIGAKLIELAKGLKRLALLPASTVQLLGAEKALFRHIKTGSRSPKHGIILNHQLVQKVSRDMKGKASRMLADKLSLCARLDYFKGEFKAKEYKKELEKALK